MHAKQLIPVDWVARAMAETLVLALHRWRKLAILPAHIHPVPDASAGCSGWWSSHRDSSRLPGAGGVHNIHGGDVRRRFLTSRWYDHSAHPLMGCYRTKKPCNCQVKPFEEHSPPRRTNDGHARKLRTTWLKRSGASRNMKCAPPSSKISSWEPAICS